MITNKEKKFFSQFISRFTAVNEPDYRNQSLRGDVRQVLVGMLAWGLLFLAAIPQDLQLLGKTTSFYWLVFLRIGYSGFTLTLAWLFWFHVKEFRSFDRLVLLWTSSSVLGSIVIYEIAPRMDEGRFLIDLVVILSLYICVPKNIINRVAPALLLTGYDLYHLLVNESLYSPETIQAVLFSYCILNITAILYSFFIFKVQFAQYRSRVEDKNTRQELQRLASTDSLTGAFNRRKLLELAGEAWYIFHRYQRPFSIIVMDLDGFKMVNDTFGHQQGDQVLVEFARLVMGEKRQADLLGRMGGDEFCLLLPETREYEAVSVAERILLLCQDISINHSQALAMQVTVSIGIGEAHLEDEILDHVFSRADAALYESKHAGKNCLSVSAGSFSGIKG